MNSNWFLFGNIKDYFWKLILGLGSIITALELFTNKIDAIFGVSFETGSYIFFSLYFVMPVLLFLMWWIFKLSQSIPSDFDDQNIIKHQKFKKFSFITVVSAGCAIFSLFIFFDLNWCKLYIPFYCIMLPVILGCIIFYIVYLTQRTQSLENEITEKKQFKEWLSLGVLHYVFLTGAVILFWGIYLYPKEKAPSIPIFDVTFDSSEVYNFHKTIDILKETNSKINTKIEAFNHEYWLEQLKADSAISTIYTLNKYNQQLESITKKAKTVQLLNEFKTLNTLLDTLKKMDEASIINTSKYLSAFDMTYNALKEAYKKHPIAKDWLSHFQVMNNNMLVKYEKGLGKKLEDFRNNFRHKGLVIFAVFLCFLLTIWLHIFLENLIAYLNRNKNEDWEDYSALGFITNYIILIVVLSIPILTATKGQLSFDSPLWASPWDSEASVMDMQKTKPKSTVRIEKDDDSHEEERKSKTAATDNTTNSKVGQTYSFPKEVKQQLNRIESHTNGIKEIQKRAENIEKNTDPISEIPELFKILDYNTLHYSVNAKNGGDTLSRPFKIKVYQQKFKK